MPRILLVVAAIIVVVVLLFLFNNRYTQWKSDRKNLEKVLIGLNKAFQEIEIIRNFTDKYSEELDEMQVKITQYKNDIEHRRTVAPIKFDGFADMAAEVDTMGTRLATLGNRLGMFGDEGAWGCPLASATLETMAEYRAKR